MSVFLSIIIPVWNSDITKLKRAINSLLSFNIPNEIIVVNDGSNVAYSEQYKLLLDEFNTLNIRYFYQKNAGVSAARNYGISVSQGRYILFIDADDELTPEYVEYINNHYREFVADWILCGICIVNATNGSKRYRPIVDLKQADKNDALIDIKFEQIVKLRATSGEVSECWGKLILRELLVKNNILFPVGISLGEDLVFNTRLMFVINDIKYIPVIGYIYNMLPKNSGRIVKEGINRYLGLHERQEELRNLIYKRIDKDKRDTYFILQNREAINVIVSDCVALWRAHKFDKDFKKFIEKWIQNECILKNLSFFKCKGLREKLNYCILKYKLWGVIAVIGRIC